MNLTKVDWLGFRTAGEVVNVFGALQAVFQPTRLPFQVRPRRRGWMGFQQAGDLCLGDMHVGLVAYGGEAQRGWVHVDISGRGCQWVDDWDRAEEIFTVLPKFEFRRVDVALDTFKREVTHETVVAAHRAGQFTTCGRPPKMTRIEPEDPRDGRTVYVGSRGQPKFLRCYEKGYELARGFPVGTVTAIDDVPIEDIYRVELEERAKHSQLPCDFIERRDQYFAGAYPYLSKVLSVEPEIFAQRRERGPQIDLAAALATIRHQYGNTMFTALAAYHGDLTAVFDRVCGMRHNQALVEAGVLLVEHGS